MSLRPERVEVAVALIPRFVFTFVLRLTRAPVLEKRLTHVSSLERYAQGDENEAQLQSLLDDVRAMVRYGVQP